MVELIIKGLHLLANRWTWDQSSASQTLPESWIFSEVGQGEETVEYDLFQPWGLKKAPSFLSLYY